MDWNIVIAGLGGIGFGSLVTTGIQLINDNRNKKINRIFEEKKTAYLEYIKIISESQFMPEKEGSWKRTTSMARIDLFGSDDVLDKLEIVSSIKDGDLKEPLKNLFKAMREDLKTY